MAGEPKAVSIIIDPLVVHARLLHGDGTESGLKFTFGRMAVAYDQAVAIGVEFVGMGGAIYRAGPTRKVPGRKGMSCTEEDWVDEDATSHRGLDD